MKSVFVPDVPDPWTIGTLEDDFPSLEDQQDPDEEYDDDFDEDSEDEAEAEDEEGFACSIDAYWQYGDDDCENDEAAPVVVTHSVSVPLSTPGYAPSRAGLDEEV